MNPRRQAPRALVVTLAAVLAGCAARTPSRPGGTESPDPTAIAAFEQATRSCPGLKTVAGELRLSGRVGGERVRGTLLAGLAAPAAVRFEAVAPFGQPFFILAGLDNRATLLLPRDNRVLVDAAVADVLERLIGLPLGAADLRRLLTGCLREQATPERGRAWAGGWRAVTVDDGVTAYLKTLNGAPAIVAADYAEWRIDYADHRNGWPRQVRIRSREDGVVDLTAAIEQLEINTDLDAKVFALAAPADAAPMSLADLKSVAPLRTSQ